MPKRFIMSKRKFNPIEGRIMRMLFQTQASLTIYGIAREIGVSFVTAKKYIKELYGEGILTKERPLSDLENGYENPKKPTRYSFNNQILKPLDKSKK